MSPRAHALRRPLAAAALVLAGLAATVGKAPGVSSVAIGDGGRTDTLPARTVDAIELAAWIREGARELHVLDLRSHAAYERDHVPSAEPADFARLEALASQAGATLVVYSDDDVRDAQASANLTARGHRNAYVLNGGMDAWMDEVMSPVLRGDSADYVAALSRYFGGAPRTTDAPRAAKPSRAEQIPAETDELGEPRRRGC